MRNTVECSICGRSCELVRREGKNGGTAYAKCGCGGMMMLSKKALAQFDAAQPEKEPAHEAQPKETDQKKSPDARSSIADDIASGIRRWWNNER